MTKVILMHGKDTNPTGKWYPWFGNEVKKLEYEYIAPILPNSADPDIEEWMSKLDGIVVEEDSVLVGHSRGGVAVMRWLERQPEDFKVSRVVLVATNSGLLTDRHVPTETNHGFYTEEGYDFEKIKSHCNDFVVIHSIDDPTVPYEAGVKNTEGLGGILQTFEGKGHFGRVTPTVPEVLEACIDFDARKALIVPVNSKGEILIQDRRGHKKPDWGYFGGGIDGDETPLEAVIRETKEELDIDIDPSELDMILSSATLWSGTIMRYFYLYHTNQEVFTVLEGKDAHWMNFEQIQAHLESEDKFEELVEVLNKE